MSRMGFYPGCAMAGSAREYNESVRAVAAALGIDLVDIPDWNCCGATAAHNINHDLALALPARNLALAEAAGLEEILVPCAACFNRLVMTAHELDKNSLVRDRIAEITGLPYRGSVRMINILDMLSRIPVEAYTEKIKQRQDYAVACYYGCLLVRPPAIMKYERFEDPQTMDDLMKLTGAKPIEWAFKVECCGAGLSVSKTEVVARLSGRIVRDAVRRGADAIVVACPMCHANLDMRRDKIEELAGEKYSIPVLYITQAIGLALGIDRETLGLQRHLVPVQFPVQEKTNAQPAATAAVEG